MTKRAFKGVWIPAEIWLNENLTIQEKVFLAVIKMDFNFKNNKEFAEFMKLSPNRIAEIKKSLYLKCYIDKKILKPKEIKNVILKGDNKNKTCEWCNNKVAILQEHHYPVLRKDGGTETVSICPNCHYTYHHLENSYDI